MGARVLVLAFVVAGVPRLARGDDGAPRVAQCRPTVSCTADLAPPGTLELELGYQVGRDNATGSTTQSTPVHAKLPLTHWLEVQVGDNGYTIAPGEHYRVGRAGISLAPTRLWDGR